MGRVGVAGGIIVTLKLEIVFSFTTLTPPFLFSLLHRMTNTYCLTQPKKDNMKKSCLIRSENELTAFQNYSSSIFCCLIGSLIIV